MIFQAYSVFLIETVQTALTGGDIYYWFITGFGDLDRLKNSRFSAIDSPTIDAIISLIVQGFFCFRIWTLNKRMWWVCVIISIVRAIRFLSALSDSSLPKLSVAQATGAAWGGIKVRYAKLPMPSSNPLLSLLRLGDMQLLSQLYTYASRFMTSRSM